MRFVYYSLLLSFVFMIVHFQSCKHGNSQKFDQEIRVTSSSDFFIPSLSKDGSISKEFSSLSKKANFSIYICNYSKNAGNNFIKQLARETLSRNDSSKTYTVIEQSQKNVNIIFLQVGKFVFSYTVKAVSDKEILIYPFNTETDIENSMIPMALLIDYNDNNDEKAIRAIKKIIESRQLEDFNESDIEYLANKSNLLNVVTYKLESKE